VSHPLAGANSTSGISGFIYLRILITRKASVKQVHEIGERGYVLVEVAPPRR
jgi:hypothetical protein